MSQEGFLHILQFDGNGGVRELATPDKAVVDGEPPVWLHLDRRDEKARRWLEEKSGLEEIVVRALLADESRPRSLLFGKGLIVNLRAINLNPGSEPDDMISLRLWIEEGRIISLRTSRVFAISDLVSDLKSRTGPRSTGEFLTELVTRVADRMEPVLDDVEDAIEDVHESEDKAGEDQRRVLSVLRRRGMTLRRYISPQRSVLFSLQTLDVPWISKDIRLQLREAGDRLERIVEDLDLALGQAAIAQDDIQSYLSERLNRRMFILAIVTTVFLPLGFVTGLLGINVGGMPGADNPLAFWLVSAILLVVAFIVLILMRFAKWF
ncbi:MAG: zinc transporter ZntB [Candidatus Sumerlaeota bacterium]